MRDEKRSIFTTSYTRQLLD